VAVRSGSSYRQIYILAGVDNAVVDVVVDIIADVVR